jgi:predicted metal-dependent RNase
MDLYEVEHPDSLAQAHCIVLASSGMMVENTMSFKLARRWLDQTRNAIFTVGYMDPATPGYRIRHSKKTDLLQLTDAMEPLSVRCDLERFSFSAHSTRSGLLSIVDRVQPNTVILVHGDNVSVDWMGYSILKKYPHIKVHGAEIGKQIMLP